MMSLTGVDVILKLLHFGSLKCLRTGLGETAHDIAVRKERSMNIVTLLFCVHQQRSGAELF